MCKGHDPDRATLLDDGTALAAIDLRPPELKRFIKDNREALRAEVGFTPPHGRCNA